MPRRKGHDPVHTFRASAELVAEARRVAEARGESLSDVIRAALERYVTCNVGGRCVLASGHSGNHREDDRKAMSSPVLVKRWQTVPLSEIAYREEQ